MFTAVVVNSSNVDLKRSSIVSHSSKQTEPVTIKNYLFWLCLDKCLVELFFARETSKSSVDIVLQRKTEFATAQSFVIAITQPLDERIKRKILKQDINL